MSCGIRPFFVQKKSLILLDTLPSNIGPHRQYGLLEDHLRQSVEGEESPCRIFASSATVSPSRPTSGVSRPDLRSQQEEEEALQLVVRGVWNQIRLESTQQDSAAWHERRRGESFQDECDPARTCEKMINALKLLANQQRNGGSPIQNIVTGVREKFWQRITNRFDKLHCPGQSLCREGRPPA